MALYLKDPEVDKAVRELARLEHSSITDAVRNAVEERKQRILEDRARRTEEIHRIVAEMRKLPVLDPRPIDEILYDEDGLPK